MRVGLLTLSSRPLHALCALGPAVSWLALTYTARSYANQTKWKKQDLFLAQLASDLLSKPFRAVLKVMQQANAITPIYLMPEDLTAANFTKDKYVSVTRGDLEAVFTPMGYEFEYTAVQQDLRRYLRHFLASMYCYNQLRRQNAFADFEFLVALRFRTISLCYNHSIFAENVPTHPQYHDKLHYFAVTNGIVHLYWGTVSFIAWLGPASGQVIDKTFGTWEKEMRDFRRLHKRSCASCDHTFVDMVQTDKARLRAHSMAALQGTEAQSTAEPHQHTADCHHDEQEPSRVQLAERRIVHSDDELRNIRRAEKLV